MANEFNREVSDYVSIFKNLGIEIYSSAGTPTANGPVKGALVVDTTNGKLYINTGTASAATWNSILDIVAGEVTLSAVVETASHTATADGLTTGAITALTGLKKFVAVTSAGATNAITLPEISAGTIGQEVFLTVGANGYELLTVASSNATINQVDSDGTNQLDVAANTTVRCTQISPTGWLAEQIAATAITVVAPDND